MRIRLFTALGSPLLTWWMSATASSLTQEGTCSVVQYTPLPLRPGRCIAPIAPARWRSRRCPPCREEQQPPASSSTSFTVTPGSPRTLLKTLCNDAVADGLLAQNPCAIRGTSVERSPERPVVTVGQVNALAEAIEGRYRAMVLLGAFCGLRLGELLALRRAGSTSCPGPCGSRSSARSSPTAARSSGRPRRRPACAPSPSRRTSSATWSATLPNGRARSPMRRCSAGRRPPASTGPRSSRRGNGPAPQSAWCSRSRPRPPPRRQSPRRRHRGEHEGAHGPYGPRQPARGAHLPARHRRTGGGDRRGDQPAGGAGDDDRCSGAGFADGNRRTPACRKGPVVGPGGDRVGEGAGRQTTLYRQAPVSVLSLTDRDHLVVAGPTVAAESRGQLVVDGRRGVAVNEVHGHRYRRPARGGAGELRTCRHPTSGCAVRPSDVGSPGRQRTAHSPAQKVVHVVVRIAARARPGQRNDQADSEQRDEHHPTNRRQLSFAESTTTAARAGWCRRWHGLVPDDVIDATDPAGAMRHGAEPTLGQRGERGVVCLWSAGPRADLAMPERPAVLP